MTTVASAAPLLDLETVVTNISIIALAVAAVVAGVWRGWQEIKKGLRPETNDPDSGVAPLAMLPLEPADLNEVIREIAGLKTEIVDLRRSTQDHTHELQQNRRAIVETSQAMSKLVNALDKMSG